MASDFLLGRSAQALAWTLVHFLWQGAIVGLVALWLLRAPRLSALARYWMGVVALAVMLIAPLATFTYVRARSDAPAFVKGAAAGQIGVASVPLAAIGRLRPTASEVQSSRSLTPAARALPVTPILVLWLAGVAILSVRLGATWLAARRLISRSTRPASGEIHSLARRVAGRLALDRIVRVCESTAVGVPVMVGWLKPVVLLPASAISGLSPTQIEALIAHELAHVRRHDYIVNLMQALVETLLFYHPAVWWVSGRVRAEREHCCDDLVVGVCDRLAYASALADLAAMSLRPHVALAAADGSLVGRVRRILGVSQDHRARGSGSVPLLVALLLVLTLAPVGFIIARGQPVRAAAAPIVTSGDVQRRLGLVIAGGTRGPLASPLLRAGRGVSLDQQTSTSENNGQFTWRDDAERVSIKWTGKFRLSDDDKDIEWIEPGKTVEVSDGGWVLTTGVVLRGLPDGSVQRSYRRRGFEQPYEPEGREYLATALGEAIRWSGFGAESRVARLLRQGGVDAVFGEIARLEGDYVRRVYYTELLKQAKLSAADLTRVASQASTAISSGYDLGALLRVASRQAGADESVQLALINATKAIANDYDQRETLLALMPSSLSPKIAAATLAAASSIGADYDRASLLIEFTRRGGLTAATSTAFFDLVKGMRSSYDQGRVLRTVMATAGVFPEVVADARKSALAIAGDFERRELLMASMAGDTLSSKDAADVIEGAAGIRSATDRASVLLRVAAKGGVTAETAEPFCALVSSMNSPYEQHRVLAQVIATPHLPDAVLAPVLKAAGSIKSDSDRAETLIAVARRQTLTPVTRPLYLAAADGIRSDYDQTRTLAELVRSERSIR